MTDLYSLRNIVARIARDRVRFERSAKNNPLFLPELAVVEKILALVQGGAIDQATRDKVRDVYEAPMAEHYNGSDWNDMCLRVEEWLEAAETLDVPKSDES